MKKHKLLSIFLICLLLFNLYPTETKAYEVKTMKSSSNMNRVSVLIEKQKQSVLKNIAANKIVSEASTTTNSSINITSPTIKNPDVNFDYTVDIRDIACTAKLYNVKNTSSVYDSKCDLNSDGIIDIYDLVQQSKHLGSSIGSPNLNMLAYVGDTYNMPGSLEAQTSDGYTTNVRSNWTSTTANTSAAKTLSISGNLTDYKKSVTAIVKVVNKTQNFNSINYGLTTIYNNKFYYSNPANNFYLSKCNLDGSCVVKICNDQAFYINVINDWIYYVNESDNEAIYKIKIDGTGRTKLVSDKTEFLNISDGWIYYSNASDYYTIYKVKIDGTQKTKLNDLTSLYVYLYGSQIYFCDYSTYTDGTTETTYDNLCAINKDGTGYKDIALTKMGPNVRIGNAIYYLDENGNLLYTKLDDNSDYWGINGANDEFTSINSDGQYLYLASNKGIYKYDVNVYTFPSPQISNGGYAINICGDCLYACSDIDYFCMIQAPLQTMSATVFGD